MLLPLQLNLAPLVQVSWAQTLPITPVVMATDVEAAFALSPGAALPVVLAVDIETAYALSPVVLPSATISWAQTLSGSNLGAVIALDVETAFTLPPLGSATATIAWAQTRLQSSAAADPRVRGTWSPALLARWQILDTGPGIGLDIETAYALAGVVDGGLPVVLALDVETAFARPPAISVVSTGLDFETAYALDGAVRLPLAAALVLLPAEGRIFRPATEHRVWRPPNETRTWRPKP